MNPPSTAEPRILVGLATYNELANLPSLLDQILRQLPEADVLVIDDNSPDGTGSWCQQHAAETSRLQCHVRSGKQGLGTATIALMQHAVQMDFDWLITMDADFSHPPDDLPALVDSLSPDVDVVLGSRYIAGGGVVGWPWRRRWMSRGVNWIARHWLRLPTRDNSGAFRCYRVSLLKQLLHGPIAADGYAFFEEVLWRLKRLGARFVEVPFVFRERQQGVSKLNRAEAFRALRLLAWLGAVERGWQRDVNPEASVR